MKHIIPLSALAISTVLAFGQSAANAQDSQSDSVTQTISQMEQDWGAALVNADLATIGRIEAPEYMFSTPDGGLETKAHGDDELKSGVYKWETFKIDDLKVNVFGDTAVVLGLETEKSTYKGADTSGQYRFTDVFVKRNGVWQAVATHVSKVAKS